MSRCLRRFEGRLFAEGGCLFMVVHADEAAEIARVSCRVDGQTQIVEMPLDEVSKRLMASATLILDNLNGPESVKRIVRGQDGWYFSAREGQMGPFSSDKDAGQALVKYILSKQTESPQRREPLRPAASRRQDQSSETVTAASRAAI